MEAERTNHWHWRPPGQREMQNVRTEIALGGWTCVVSYFGRWCLDGGLLEHALALHSLQLLAQPLGQFAWHWRPPRGGVKCRTSRLKLRCLLDGHAIPPNDDRLALASFYGSKPPALRSYTPWIIPVCVLNERWAICVRYKRKSRRTAIFIFRAWAVVDDDDIAAASSHHGPAGGQAIEYGEVCKEERYSAVIFSIRTLTREHAFSLTKFVMAKLHKSANVGKGRWHDTTI